MSMASLEQLIEDSKVLEEVAGRIQQGEIEGLPSEEIERFVNSYQVWYAEALALLPDDLKERFQIEYEKKTGAWDLMHKIKHFLQAPTRKNPFYKPDNPLLSYWAYPYEVVFRSRLLSQRQILLEASRRQPKLPVTIEEKDVYVDPERIEELRLLPSNSFDLSKLIKTCEELNICYANKCYYATGMLVRSILDHVPPVFGFKTFAEVTSNYGGTKSFKEAMRSLQETCRKISDSYLHTLIRNKEVLPNKMQVEFSASLDLVLSEIVRVLK